jgi:hypothetical protein
MNLTKKEIKEIEQTKNCSVCNHALYWNDAICVFADLPLTGETVKPKVICRDCHNKISKAIVKVMNKIKKG